MDTQPFIRGGYQSPDIRLRDQFATPPVEVPHGGQPGGSSDTELEPSRPYDYFALVHNPPQGESVDVLVHFWHSDGGVGSNGTHVGCAQGFLEPGDSSVPFVSPAPFVSDVAGQSRCAIVSVAPADGNDCSVTPLIEHLPANNGDNNPSPVAWRNTFSTEVSDRDFVIDLETNWPDVDEQFPPVTILIDTIHIPSDWTPDPEIVEQLISEGWPEDYPFYLLPWLEGEFQHGIIPVEVTSEFGVEQLEHNMWQLAPEREVPFQIFGTFPDLAVDGDLFLVDVSADYARTETTPERRIEFTRIFKFRQ
jgi:hypothetical protein